MKYSCWLSLLLIFVCCRNKQVAPEEFIFPTFPEYDTGYKYHVAGNLDSAFFYYTLASEKSDDSIIKAIAYTSMASIHYQYGDYFGSQEAAVNALQLLPSGNKSLDYTYSAIYNELGRSYDALGNYAAANEYYRKALVLQSDTTRIEAIKNNMAIALRNEGNYREAIDLFESILKKKSEKNSNYPVVLLNLAHAKWKANAKFNPERDLKNALAMQEEESSKYFLSGIYNHLSEFYLESNPDSARHYATLMLNVATDINSPEDRLIALKRLSLLASSAQAKSYFRQYTDLSDSIQREKSNSRNQLALIKYEAANFRATISQLSEANAAKALHILRQQIILITCVLLALGLLIWFSRRSRKKRKRIELDAQNAIRESQLKTSQKVHDVVANGLYRIMSEVEHQPDIKKEQLLDQIEMLYEKSRDISYDDKASAAQNKDRITELLSAFNSNDRRIVLVGADDIQWDQFPAPVLQTLETVLQELLVNMSKHSQAKNVVIRFQQKPGELLLHYTDDGKGLPADFKKGNGIQNTENRIRRMGGRIIFTARQPSGLSVQINLPNLSE